MKKLFLFLALFYTLLNAKVTFHDEMQKIDSFELSYYFHANQTNTIESIQKQKFTKKTSNFFTFGYIDGDTWFKLKVENNSTGNAFVFQLLEPYFQRINFYVEINGTWQKQEAGLTLYKEDKNTKHLRPNFYFNIKPHQSKTIYVQFAPKAGKATSSFGRFIVSTQAHLSYANPFNEYLFYFFFFGSMFILIIFSLFLYLIFREKIYLYYSLYIFFLSIYISIYSGLLLHLGLASWHKEFSLSLPLFLVFLIAFSDTFLKLKEYLPRIHKIFKYISLSMIISLPYMLYDYDTWTRTIGVSTLLISPIMMFSAFYVVYKGHSEAKYYIPGIFLYIIALSILPLMVKGFIAHTSFTHYVFTTFSYIEVMFFSLVLVRRFYHTQTQKIILQNELLDIQKDNKKRLEAQVKERTTKINQLLKEKENLLREVYHRVKNNFHMVISLLWIKHEDKPEEDKDNSLLELINRIKSMSLIHQYLLESDNFSEILSQQYIGQINDEIENSYAKENIKISHQIDRFTLTANQALSLGIIINELLTNAVKYHTVDSICKVNLSCQKEANNIKLIIHDNGKGFNLKTTKRGFGLNFIKQFAKKLHASQSEFSFDKGTKYTLVFEL